MDYNLFEKNVLITGAANGIGASVVRYLAEEGIKNIYMLDVDEEAGTKLKAEINTKLKKEVVKFFKCDVSQEDELFEVFEVALKDCGYIDVVINNAGLADESSSLKIRKLVEVYYRPDFFSKTGVRVIALCIGHTNTSLLDKVRCFDEEMNKEHSIILGQFPSQSPECAARCVLEVLKSGESGSTWLSSDKKLAEDISESVTKAYGILTQTFT